jgi:hypothetical protein
MQKKSIRNNKRECDSIVNDYYHINSKFKFSSTFVPAQTPKITPNPNLPS